MSKSIYIGNGFMDGQLLFIIPFVDGYAKEKKIIKLIFESSLSNEVKSQVYITDILNRYIVKEETRLHGLRKYLHLICPLIILIIPALRLARKTTSNGLLENVPWYESQLRHAVWDQTLQGVSDGSIELPFKKRFMSAMRVLLSVKKAKNLYIKEEIEAAILGHTVYVGRARLATFQSKKIDTIAHAGNKLYRTFPDKDTASLSMSRSEWTMLSEMIDQVRVDEYWNKRLEGKSSYSDAERAAKSKRSISSRTPKNIIFLHIFRDSPFNQIDRSRIFSDYVRWVIETLKILSESDEQWLIKIHPSALRWGESQMAWLKSIGHHVFYDSWPEHIEIDDIGYSNIELLENARRIVTYRGTVHLEAACMGIKPIVISEVSLSSFNQNLVHKPKSFTEYKQLLLCPEDSNSFYLADKDKNDAKRLLFIREEILSFAKDVGDLPIYRGDPRSLFIKQFDSISKNSESFSPFLTKIGAAMAKGLTRSVRVDYFDQWYHLYLSGK